MRWRTSGSSAKLHHLLDEPLARLVGRVRLAGDDELHGTLGVEQQASCSRAGSRSIRVSRL